MSEHTKRIFNLTFANKESRKIESKCAIMSLKSHPKCALKLDFPSFPPLRYFYVVL